MDVENEVDDDIKDDQEASVAANHLFSNTNPKGYASLLNTHEIQLLEYTNSFLLNETLTYADIVRGAVMKCDTLMDAVDVVFPEYLFTRIFSFTNTSLRRSSKKITSKQEFNQFFGTLLKILVSHHSVESFFQIPQVRNKDFDHMLLSKTRFQEILQHLCGWCIEGNSSGPENAAVFEAEVNEHLRSLFPIEYSVFSLDDDNVFTHSDSIFEERWMQRYINTKGSTSF